MRSCVGSQACHDVDMQPSVLGFLLSPGLGMVWVGLD